MTVEFVCDGCGKRAPAVYGASGDAFKPSSWFQRSDEDGPQHACSRACIDVVAKKTGKTDAILPI